MQATQPASFDGLEFDAIITRSEKMESEIPEYATEAGYSVSDNICLKSRVLDIEAIFTNSPVTWAESHSASLSRVESMCEELRQKWLNKTVGTFTANGDSYDNMCIESCTTPRTVEDGSSARVTLTLKQITITSTDTAAISSSYVRGGTSSKNTGAAGTKSSSASASSSGTSSGSSSKSSSGETKASVLCGIGKSIGVLKD